jgi:hypothetical protein
LLKLRADCAAIQLVRRVSENHIERAVGRPSQHPFDGVTEDIHSQSERFRVAPGELSRTKVTFYEQYRIGPATGSLQSDGA